MGKAKVYFNKLSIRLKVCYKILFRKYDHFVLINVDMENLVKIIKDENFETNLVYHGVQPYLAYRMIEMVACDEDEMILKKALFEGKVAEYMESKHQHN
jgi:hypothetical protein